jgi:predicted metal-dependent HD superfamily phosphohydrolase
VREEYGHLSDAEFTAGRTAVLEHLLALPALYRLPAVAAEWTPRARANLAAELSLLQRRAAPGSQGSPQRNGPPASS